MFENENKAEDVLDPSTKSSSPDQKETNDVKSSISDDKAKEIPFSELDEETKRARRLEAAVELRRRLREMHQRRGLTQPTQEEIARAMGCNLKATVFVKTKTDRDKDE